MLNWPRVGLVFFFFIPALWQGHNVKPTLFPNPVGWLCHFLSLLIDKLSSVQSDLAKTLITASATILVAAITLVAGKLWEQRLRIRDEIRAKKIPIYEKHIHTFFEILYAEKFTGKPADPQKQVRAFAEFAELAIIWGSSDVIKSWAAFREASEVAKTPDQKLDILENLFISRACPLSFGVR